MKNINQADSHMDKIGLSIDWCYRNGYEVNEMFKDLLIRFKDKISEMHKDEKHVHIDTYYKECNDTIQKDIIEYRDIKNRAIRTNKFEGIVFLLIIKQILDDFYFDNDMKDMIEPNEIPSMIEKDFVTKWRMLFKTDPKKSSGPSIKKQKSPKKPDLETRNDRLKPQTRERRNFLVKRFLFWRGKGLRGRKLYSKLQGELKSEFGVSYTPNTISKYAYTHKLDKKNLKKS